MSDSPPAETRPPRARKRLTMIALALAMVAAGGGGAYGMMAAGIIGSGGAAHEPQDDFPKLIRKGETDPYAPPADEGHEEAGAAEVHGEGGSRYRTAYYTFAEDFTSNLKDSDALVQVSLAASTRRDGRVLLWIRLHELAVRSALLQVLADTPEADVATLAGKQRLQKRLAGAINGVLVQKEGFGGVDSVYFKSFIVQ